jgi:hypothetical protein
VPNEANRTARDAEGASGSPLKRCRRSSTKAFKDGEFVRAKYQGVEYDATVVGQRQDGLYNVHFDSTDGYWDCSTRKEDIHKAQ